MYTNTKNYGGNFRNVLDKEFKNADSVTIASGYASLSIIKVYESDFVKIAQNGGVSRLLLGMAFYEGLREKQLKAVTELNEQLKGFGNSSGVYVARGRRYHGKIYHFENQGQSNLYVGSSNFSSSGTQGNIECTISVSIQAEKIRLIQFLQDLYSSKYSIRIDKVKIPISGKKIPTVKIQSKWDNLDKYDVSTIDKTNLPKLEFPLERIVNQPKSNLNIYFGKGRQPPKGSKGKIIPRAWYEAEITSSKSLTALPDYPKRDFLAYTDDGYIIPMTTHGDYNKNLRSKNGLQIFGIWIKGKLERAGALQKYEPVTLDTLIEYGNSTLILYKIDDDKYYMEF